MSFFLSLIHISTVAEAVSGYDASMLLSVLLYLIPTVFQLHLRQLRRRSGRSYRSRQSVSYTHLDVYKRQERYRALIATLGLRK